MTDIHGSIPVFSFVISNSIKNYITLSLITKRLQKMGWTWYKDFSIKDDTGGTLFEIYNEKLVGVVIELIVEYNI